MNGLLQLKGRFNKRGNEGMGPVSLPAHKKVTSEHIEKLINQLLKVKQYWSDKEDIGGLIVSVHYIRVVAKSNRLKTLLADVGKKPVDSIRGAKFVTGADEKGKTIHKHVFTHYVQTTAIDKAIYNLQIVKGIVDRDYNGCIKAEDIKILGKEKKYLHADKIAKTTFVNAVVDIYSDILSVDLETGDCSYIYTENRVMEEIQLPQKWDEAKKLILESIDPEDHEAVLAKWDSHMTVEAEADTAFSVDYHSVLGKEGRRNPLWRMNILIIEDRRKKKSTYFL